MNTLHIETRVHDFDAWKAVFDKFDRFRVDHGVRSHRMSRDLDDPQQVTIDLDFDSVEEATTFRSALEKIWATPQSREQVVAHATPVLRTVVENTVH